MSRTRFLVNTVLSVLLSSFIAEAARACSAPVITEHPQSVTIPQGSATTLTVSATGATAYQWYGGQPGEMHSPITNSQSVTLAPTQTTPYWVRVSNACAATDSHPAVVTVACAQVQLLATWGAFSKLGGYGSTTVQHESRCTPQPTSNASFITIVRVTQTSLGYHDVVYTVARNETGVTRSGTITVGSATYTVYQTGHAAPSHTDFNGDGVADLLWRSQSSGATYPWLMKATSVYPGTTYVTPHPWSVKGMGDFDGDGKADILWRNLESSQTSVWFMNGQQMRSGAPLLPVSPAWIVQAVGDFNGDGRSDIVWRHNSTYETAVWLMHGASILSAAVVAVPGPQWTANGAGDFDGDGKADLLWRNSDTSEAVLWLMNGTTIQSVRHVASPNAQWSVKGTGDFNADGLSDIVWANTSNEIVVWLMSGGSIISAGYTAQPPMSWQLQGVGDFDADGKSDLAWRQLTTGENLIWFMNGINIRTASATSAVYNLSTNIVAPR